MGLPAKKIESRGKILSEEFAHFVRGIDRNLATPEFIETRIVILSRNKIPFF
jgi:hypothetical protein